MTINKIGDANDSEPFSLEMSGIFKAENESFYLEITSSRRLQHHYKSIVNVADLNEPPRRRRR